MRSQHLRATQMIINERQLQEAFDQAPRLASAVDVDPVYPIDEDEKCLIDLLIFTEEGDKAFRFFLDDKLAFELIDLLKECACECRRVNGSKTDA